MLEKNLLYMKIYRVNGFAYKSRFGLPKMIASVKSQQPNVTFCCFVFIYFSPPQSLPC